MQIVSVLIEHPIRHLDTCFDYIYDQTIQPGVRVRVMFGRQKLVGLVRSVHTTCEDLASLEERQGFRYKPILEVLDQTPLLNQELDELAQKLSRMTFTPLINCIKVMLPPSLKPSSTLQIGIKTQKVVRFGQFVEGLTDRQYEVLKAIQKQGTIPLKEVQASRPLLKKLQEKQCITIFDQEVYREASVQGREDVHHTLTDEQRAAVASMLSPAARDKPILLHGVTGSGKTEVYLQLASHMLKQGQQVLMLVPEISLTPKLTAVFMARFPSKVAIWHSRMSDGERYDTYRRIAAGQVDVVVGARSAVFAPLSHIGLIILDEEHDASYKQESSPRYHTRDVALLRQRYHHALLVLGSASPSLESYARASTGRYHLVTLKHRVFAQALPKAEIVDMGQEMRSGNYSYFSRSLKTALQHCLQQGHQALLLMNRRGYANYMMCSECHTVLKCPHCDVSLTYHKMDRSLRCHYCGYEIPLPSACPECGSALLTGKGSGTEKIAEALQDEFPGVGVIRYDLDTTSRKGAHEKLLSDFENQKAQILLGTQMIAKGLDFKNVTLVGILDADQSLNIPDYRSFERTFDLILQVAGRAGRDRLSGRVIIQTLNPSQYPIVLGARQDYEAFYKKEIASRALAVYPPYCYMLSILFSYKQEDEVVKVATQVAAYLQTKVKQIHVLGPSVCLIAKMHDDYRYRVLVKYTKHDALFEAIRTILENLKTKVKIDIDVNPYSQM